MTINFIPQARINFTRREVDLMLMCSECHYDAVCKSLSTKGEDQSGLLRGNLSGLLCQLKSRIEREIPLPFLSFRELDTFAKCLEMYPHIGNVEAGAEAFMLGGKLHRALKAINEHAAPDVEVEV